MSGLTTFKSFYTLLNINIVSFEGQHILGHHAPFTHIWTQGSFNQELIGPICVFFHFFHVSLRHLPTTVFKILAITAPYNV